MCGALAEQRVRVERFDGKLLVSYRNMYIREIDLERCQRTKPLVGGMPRTFRRGRSGRTYGRTTWRGLAGKRDATSGEKSKE